MQSREDTLHTSAGGVCSRSGPTCRQVQKFWRLLNSHLQNCTTCLIRLCTKILSLRSNQFFQASFIFGECNFFVQFYLQQFMPVQLKCNFVHVTFGKILCIYTDEAVYMLQLVLLMVVCLLLLSFLVRFAGCLLSQVWHFNSVLQDLLYGLHSWYVP